MTDQQLRDLLWDLASQQRWFPGRGGTVAGARAGEAVEVHDARLLPAVLEVAFPDGRREDYLIPLVLRDGKPPMDACDDGAVLLEALRSGAPGFEATRPIPAGLPARRFAGEQSNTTVFFSDQLLAKVFRRIEPGINVDVELHEVLAGSGVAAELYGRWRVDGTDYAVFLEALPDPTDGYVLACRHARDGADFTTHAWALGEALATVHRTLAERLPSDTTASGAVLAAGFRRRFAQVEAEVDEVATHSAAVDAVFGAIADEVVATQRIHGDCHLGQVLLTRGRWVYVDFEGEPMASLEERRAPDTPLRDLAGMLRSFGYARADGGAPASWLLACRRAFLEGYGLDPDVPNPLLTAYETDKAGYEVSYEARYRPHLMRVPLDFLSQLPEGA